MTCIHVPVDSPFIGIQLGNIKQWITNILHVRCDVSPSHSNVYLIPVSRNLTTNVFQRKSFDLLFTLIMFSYLLSLHLDLLDVFILKILIQMTDFVSTDFERTRSGKVRDQRTTNETAFVFFLWFARHSLMNVVPASFFIWTVTYFDFLFSLCFNASSRCLFLCFKWSMSQNENGI